MYKESFSPKSDKTFCPTCLADRKKRNSETARKVELA